MPGLLQGLLGGGAPQAQVPGQRQGILGTLFDPAVALPMAAALMGSQGNAANVGNAFAAAAPALQQRRTRNMTAEWIQKNAPEFAGLLETGVDPKTVLEMAVKRRYAEKPDPYKSVGGHIFNTEDQSWISPPGGGQSETGLVPQLMQDENGNMIYVQPTKDGRLIPSQAPEGYRPVSPYDKSFQTKLGATEGENAAGFQQAEGKASQMLTTLETLESHPGLSGVVGWQGSIPEWMIPGGTAGAGAISVMNQVQGQAFLQAFESLKGGGQITEVEGQKATQAITRLNRKLSEAEFKEAIGELRQVLTAAQERARAGVVVDPTGRTIYQRGGAAAAPTPAPVGNGGANTTSTGATWRMK